ncbi:MAG: aldehyde dehydrogenase family protein, partial [Pseudomonadales bacterium]
MAERLPQYIDGAFVQSTTTEWLPVRNPATQEILCEVPVATDEEMAQAVASAKAAFASWKEVAVPER